MIILRETNYSLSGARKVEDYVSKAQEMSKTTGKTYKECLNQLIANDKKNRSKKFDKNLTRADKKKYIREEYERGEDLAIREGKRKLLAHGVTAAGIGAGIGALVSKGARKSGAAIGAGIGATVGTATGIYHAHKNIKKKGLGGSAMSKKLGRQYDEEARKSGGKGKYEKYAGKYEDKRVLDDIKEEMSPKERQTLLNNIHGKK